MTSYKHPGLHAVFVRLVFALLASFPLIAPANFTLPLNAGLPGQAEPALLQQHTGYGTDNLDDQFKKRPPWGGHSGSQSSLWLVPVLRYLISVNAVSMTMSNAPVMVLLPVLLESASHWWFHGQAVLEKVHDSGETPAGNPVPFNLYPTGGGSGNNAASSNDAGPSGEASGDQADTDKPPPFNIEAFAQALADRKKGGDGGQSRGGHCCGEPCPACNGDKCHCSECIAAIKRKQEQAVRGQNALLPRRPSRNIVNIIAGRQTGNNAVTLSDLTALSQHRFQGISIPSAVNEYYTRLLGVFPDGRQIIQLSPPTGCIRSGTISCQTSLGEYFRTPVPIAGLNIGCVCSNATILSENQFLLDCGALNVFTEVDGQWVLKVLAEVEDQWILAGLYQGNFIITDQSDIIQWVNNHMSVFKIVVWINPGKGHTGQTSTHWSSDSILSRREAESTVYSRIIGMVSQNNGLVSLHRDGSLTVWLKRDFTWGSTHFSGLPDSTESSFSNFLTLRDNAFVIWGKHHIGVWNKSGETWKYSEIVTGSAQSIQGVRRLSSGQLVYWVGADQSSITILSQQGSVWTPFSVGQQKGTKDVLVLEGNQFVSSGENTIAVWSQHQGQWRRTPLAGMAKTIEQILPLKDGRFVGITGQGNVYLWYNDSNLWAASLVAVETEAPSNYDGHRNILMNADNLFLLNDGRLAITFLYFCFSSLYIEGLFYLNLELANILCIWDLLPHQVYPPDFPP